MVPDQIRPFSGLDMGLNNLSQHACVLTLEFSNEYSLIQMIQKSSHNICLIVRNVYLFTLLLIAMTFCRLLITFANSLDPDQS